MSGAPRRPSPLDLEERQIRERARARLFGHSRDQLRYQIRGKLGAGGMGVVYKAYDPVLDCNVALKQLRSRDPDERSLLEQLRREARHMAKLRGQPNIVMLYDFFAEGEATFVVMELVDGPNLRVWQAGERSWQDILAVYLQAGEGLRMAHAVGLEHRDFKPENVLIAPGGVAKVADFGLAYSPGTPTREDSSRSDSSRSRTSEGLVGTLFYVTPEQLAGTPGGPASDQYSFCVALHEALFGGHPMLPPGTDLTALRRPSRTGAHVDDHPLRRAILAGQFQAPSRRGGVPRHIEEALRRGTARAPDERYPSMQALLAALSARPGRRRSVLAAAALLGLGVAAWALDPPPTQAEQVATSRAQIDGEIDIPALRRRHGESAVIDRLAGVATAWAEANGAQAFADQRGLDVEAPTRRACLELARTRLVELSVVLRGTVRLDSVGAADVLAALPDPRDCRALAEPWLRCDDDEAKERERWPGPDVVDAMQVAEHLELIGDYETASAQAQAAARRTEQQAMPLLRSRAFLLAGRLLQLSERPAEALEALQRANEPIEGRECLGLRVDIASRSVKVIAQNPSVPAEQARHWQRTQMNLARALKDERREATAHSDAGLFAWLREGRPAEAIVALTRARHLRASAPEEVSAEARADTSLNLGGAALAIDDLGRARRELNVALRERGAAYGEDHPLLYREHHQLGLLEFAEGRHGPALAQYDRAHALALAGYGAQSGPATSVLVGKAQVLLALGRLSEALEVVGQAAEDAIAARMDPVVRIELVATLEALRVRAGDPQAAIVGLERLVREVEANPSAHGSLAMILLQLAEVHAALEQTGKAELRASQAVALLDLPGAPDDPAVLGGALLLRAEQRLEERTEQALADLEQALLVLPPGRKLVRARLLLGWGLQVREQPSDLTRSCELLGEATVEASRLSDHEVRDLQELFTSVAEECGGPEKKIVAADDRRAQSRPR